MSESFRIALVDLKDWLEKETITIIKPLKDKGKSLLDEVRDRLDDVRESGDRVFSKSDKEMQKGSSKTYRCAKAANKMSKNISGKLDQIDVSDDITYENFKLLIGDLQKAFAAIEHERRVWDRRISPYFILDRRRLDITIKRAKDSVQELHRFLVQEYVDVKTAENALDMVDKLSQLLEEVKDVQKRRIRTETRLKLLEEKMGKDEQRISLVQGQTELDELSRIEHEIGDLKAKVKYSLRHLQKPFYKMQSLARRAEVALPPEETRKLVQYMENPFEALSSEEEGYPILKSMLRKLDDAIRQGKLKLKTARLRKAREQINGVLRKDSLANLHNDCLEAVSKRKQLLTSKAVAATKDELGQLQTALQNLQKRKESVESRRRVLEEERQRILKRVEVHKGGLESSIFELTNKKVQIAFAKAK